MSVPTLRCHATVRRAVQLASQRGASSTRSRDEVVVHREERCDTPLVPIPHPERPFWLCPVQHGSCGRYWITTAVEAANPDANLKGD